MLKSRLIKDLKEITKQYFSENASYDITRDYYVRYSKYSKCDYEKEFGNWTEFKKMLIIEMFNGEDLLKVNVKLAKQKQAVQDINRIERKTFRESARKDNALEELDLKLIELLEKNSLKDFTIRHDTSTESTYHGVYHITDNHLNELIFPSTSLTNQFDFTVASKRLKKYADTAREYCKLKNIKNITLAFGGDQLNSSRRRDEVLSQATNRVSAVLLAVFLYEQLIIDLNQDFNVSIASVTGNESRNTDEFVYSEIADENFDHMIHNILKMLFRGAEGVTFIEGSFVEKVLSFGDFNLLLLHGDKLRRSNIEKEVQGKIAKYMQRGVPIHYTIFGHLHTANISDIYARGSSLCGANAYSEEGLNLISRASQNLYLIDIKNKSLDGIKIDLQDTEGIEGYDINKELEAYNTKSADKLYDSETIVRIVV
jgi:hypothetical protein